MPYVCEKSNGKMSDLLGCHLLTSNRAFSLAVPFHLMSQLCSRYLKLLAGQRFIDSAKNCLCSSSLLLSGCFLIVSCPLLFFPVIRDQH